MNIDHLWVAGGLPQHLKLLQLQCHFKMTKGLDERNHLEAIGVCVRDNLRHVRLTVRVVRGYIPVWLQARNLTLTYHNSGYCGFPNGGSSGVLHVLQGSEIWYAKHG